MLLHYRRGRQSCGGLRFPSSLHAHDLSPLLSIAHVDVATYAGEWAETHSSSDTESAGVSFAIWYSSHDGLVPFDTDLRELRGGALARLL